MYFINNKYYNLNEEIETIKTQIFEPSKKYIFSAAIMKNK